ncbi:porin family protein [Leyella stercorea]
MKKIFTSAAIALAMLFTANTANAGINFGLKGGLNVTSMSLDSKVFDASNRAGFFIGPTLKFTLPIVGLGIDASALYDQREAKLTVADKTKETVKTQAINIPINARYSVGLGSVASVLFFAGPQFGFNVGDKDVDLGGDSRWKFRSSQFSVNVGAGFSFMNHFEVTANYNIACGKTGDATLSKTVNEVFKDNGRTNAWQIALAYYF